MLQYYVKDFFRNYGAIFLRVNDSNSTNRIPILPILQQLFNRAFPPNEVTIWDTRRSNLGNRYDPNAHIRKPQQRFKRTPPRLKPNHSVDFEVFELIN